MSITIQLSDEEMAELRRAAEAQGVSAEEVAGERYRASTVADAPAPGSVALSGPPNPASGSTRETETLEERIERQRRGLKRLLALADEWTSKNFPPGHYVDVSRESIYD